MFLGSFIDQVRESEKMNTRRVYELIIKNLRLQKTNKLSTKDLVGNKYEKSHKVSSSLK